jgi:hypothetical protein
VHALTFGSAIRPSLSAVLSSQAISEPAELSTRIPALNPTQLADAVLDAVERPPHVQSAKDDIPAAGEPAQPCRLVELCSDAALVQRADEKLVREGRAFRDHTHAVR